MQALSRYFSFAEGTVIGLTALCKSSRAVSIALESSYTVLVPVVVL